MPAPPAPAFAPVTRLESPRLVLRPAVADDLQPLMAVNGDDETTRFLPYPTWRTIDDAASWLARMRTLADGGTAQQLVLVSKSTSAAIGTLLLFKHDAPSGRVEIGYVLGRLHWGRGLAREALLAACAHLFDTGGIRRIEAEVNPANAASCRLLDRLGFVHEGTLRQRWVGRAGTYDSAIYGLLGPDLRRDGTAVG